MQHFTEESMAKYTREDCPLYGTRYCKTLNRPGCKDCTAAGNAEATRQYLNQLEELLPEGGIGRFYTGDKCMLCRGEEKGAASCFAMADIGNPNPPATGRNVIGIPIKLTAGSILSLQLSCCGECRKKHRAMGDSHVVYTVITAAALLILLNITPVAEALAGVASFLPLALFLGGTAGVWFWGRARHKKLVEQYKKETFLNVFDIPGLEELKEKGWFEINPARGRSRLIFSGEPLKCGLYTGEWPTAEETGENI